MPDREDVLREKAFKEQGLDISQRVFYTLTAGLDKTHRPTVLLADLIARLHEKGVLTDDEVDDMLLGIIG